MNSTGSRAVRRLLLGLGLLAASPASATVLADWSLEEVASRADWVFVGTVLEQRVLEGEGTLLTASTLKVDESLYSAAGARPGTAEIRELGGRLGKRWVDVPGTAGLTKGKRYLLFTFQHPDGQRYLVGMELGAYLLGPDGRAGHTVDVGLIGRDGRVRGAPGLEETTVAKVRALLRRLHP